MMNMQAGIPKAQLMAGDAMNRALTRMAHEMMEQLMPLENVVLVGIRRRGVPLAQRLSDIIEKYEHVRIPVGEVDIAMYRDDRDPAQLNVEVQEKHLPVDVTGKDCIDCRLCVGTCPVDAITVPRAALNSSHEDTFGTTKQATLA